jgi:hypothetical protein
MNGEYTVRVGSEKPASEVLPNGRQVFEGSEGSFQYALFIQGWREAMERVVGALNDMHIAADVLRKLKYIDEPKQVYFSGEGRE